MTYLKTLRELRRISQGTVATAAGVDDRQVRRWEAGKYKPSLPQILKVTQAVQGSFRHVVDLVAAEDATEQTAIQLAYDWVNSDIADLLDADINAIPDEKLREAINIVRDFQRKDKIDEFIRLFRG